MSRKQVYINIDEAADDPDALFVYIDSDRSDGKTTNIIRRVYDEFHESGLIGVIARRFATAVTTDYAATLFTNLRKVRRNAGKLTTGGSVKKDGGLKLYEDGKQFAVLCALSKADTIKSGLDVATHKNLYIDEYVPICGRYLPNEMNAIAEIWQTIDRKTYTNKVIICSNKLTASNPVFSYFQILPKKGLTRYKNGRFILLRVSNKGNAQAVEESPLAELFEGTPYLDYMTGGTLERAAELISATHSRNRLSFVMEVAGKIYGLYYGNTGLVIAPAVQRKGERCYSTRKNGGARGTVYLGQNRDLLHALRVEFQSSRIFANSEVTLYEIADLWKILAGSN